MAGLSRPRQLLFDLDGTLVDSRGTIAASIAWALEQIGHDGAGGPAVETLIGMPLYDIFTERYGLERSSALHAIDLYRAHYDRISPQGSRIYDGVPEDLGRLRARGLGLYVATVKPTSIARKVLADVGLAALFDGVAGASMGPERRDKASIIAHALDRFGLDPADCLMVGDRDQDVNGARANGLRAVGVTYGFGSADEIAAARPDAVVTRSGAIDDLVGGWPAR